MAGEGVCGYFMDRSGGSLQPWAYRDGASYLSDYAQLTISGEPYKPRNPDFRVAVLTGPRTMSSGEVTTLAFRGKANTLSFGQPTGGYSTTNTTRILSDGAMVILTVSIYGDREKNGYDDKVMPDVLVEETEREDAALAAALAWLRKEK